jgi:hypothetical protein
LNLGRSLPEHVLLLSSSVYAAVTGSGFVTDYFIAPKAYPLRFMYLAYYLFFFMILPMTFTIFIGLTNLGTGHLLAKDKVYEMLKSESIDTDESFPFKLKHEGKNFNVVVTGEKIWSATFSLKEEKVLLKETPTVLTEEMLKVKFLFPRARSFYFT